MKLIWRLATIILLLFALTPNTRQVSAQQEDATETNLISEEAVELWSQLTPEERVGQLFVVTFAGDITAPESAVVDLIQNYYVGGVLLQASNDNINAAIDVPNAVARLTNSLQAWSILTFDPNNPISAGEGSPTPAPVLPRQNGIPLFIAISQPGDGFPDDQILRGMTQLPSQVALGATWRPELSELAGSVLGSELAAMGVNLLLGPSLDVMAAPAGFSGNNASLTFGGHPYWVSQHSNAYISGLEQGSQGRILVVPGRFPGLGASDRPTEQDIATVRKTIEELQTIDLLPFLKVTQANADTDQPGGLQLSHLRYQGLQGNVNSATLPFAFDPAAIEQLLSLTPLNEWRAQGGLLVSGPLGSQAVERFYDPQGNEFPHRVIAKDAFLAGNDLLILDSFALGNGDIQGEYDNVRDTILWFREKYTSDPSFQMLIDDAVLRILQKKIDMYDGTFSLNNINPNLQDVSAIVGQQGNVPLEIAQSAITLVSPGIDELAAQLPGPPSANDRIVIFTDVRSARQCSTCEEFAQLGPTTIQDQILELYGPFASGQVQLNQINSFTFEDLATYLAAGTEPIVLPLPTATATIFPAATATADGTATSTPLPTATPLPEFLVQEALGQSTWIIFAMQDDAIPGASADVVSRFLAEQPAFIQNNTVVALAFDAPLYLDTTEISQLNAYYAIYSQTSAFVDASVRALFQELQPRGALPINVQGIGYEINEMTQPTAEQVIALFIAQDGELISPASDEPLEVFVGNTLRLTTGIIRDRNGFRVPDGTIVSFVQQDRIQGFFNEIGQSETIDGVAIFDYFLEARTGQFRISVASGDAVRSESLDLVIDSETSGAVVISSPTPLPTQAATPTDTPIPSVTPTTAPTATPIPAPTPIIIEPEPSVNIPVTRLWLVSSLFLGIGLLGVMAAYVSQQQGKSLTRQVQWTFLALLGGLIVYNWYLFELPFPGRQLWETIGAGTPLILLALGGCTALLIVWWRQSSR